MKLKEHEAELMSNISVRIREIADMMEELRPGGGFRELIETSTQKPSDSKPAERIETQGIPLNEFWEKDDGESMDEVIRIERFIRSRGTDSAQIWGAWYDIKQKLKAMHKLTAEERAQQLFHGKRKDVPKLAMEYIKYLSNKYGGCSEMFLTGAAHYAQVIEGLTCTDDLYKIDEEGKDWFEKNK
jgi:hypothetical protein